ncbi:MAG: acyl-CoA thioesterase II [Actinomycetia bacterium]|nr:acyl-CoA thioesterase II [Actinomycetes bacterium]
MPNNVDELIATLRLTPAGDGQTFRGGQVRTYFQRTFGGEVLAQALLAAYRSVTDPDRAAHSLNAYFLRAADATRPIDYKVQNLRDGGSFSTRRVTAIQSGTPVFTLSASFHRDEPGLDHALPQPTVGVPDPEECRPISEVLDERFGPLPLFHEWDCLDVRFAGDSTTVCAVDGSSPQAWMRVWARTESPLPPDAPPRLHQAVLAYLSDMTLLSVSALPHEIAFISNQVQAASLGHSMWFHRPAHADRWLLYDMVSPNAHASIGFSSGHLFQDGELIASCSQEGLVRVVDDRPMLT